MNPSIIRELCCGIIGLSYAIENIGQDKAALNDRYTELDTLIEQLKQEVRK